MGNPTSNATDVKRLITPNQEPAPSYSVAGPSTYSDNEPFRDFEDAALVGSSGKAGDEPGDDDELPAYNDLTDPAYLGEEPPPFSKYSPTKHLISNGKVVSLSE